jgi:hypothetical protein
LVCTNPQTSFVAFSIFLFQHQREN